MKKLKLILCTFSLMLILIVATSMTYADSTPEGTPISTAEQLFALSNSSGSYYLANDIDVAGYANKQITFFKGTLDGNGHAIKGYTIDDSTGVFGNDSNYYRASLFNETSTAVFKNLRFEDVNIDICIDKAYDSVKVSLFGITSKTSFSNIEIGGKFNVENSFDTDFISVSALSSAQQNPADISEIRNDASMKVHIGACKAGIVEVSAIGRPSNGALKYSNIQNNGNIIINASEDSQVSKFWIDGLVRNSENEDISFENSSNTGKISVTNNGSKKASVYISGLSIEAEAFNKCYNTGSISFKGKADRLMITGLTDGTEETTNIKQCYNSGSIKATASNRSGNTVWLAGLIVELKPDGTISNSYNTGNITYSGNSKNYAVLAGITSNQREDSSIKFCYNTGTIKGSGKSDEASISDGFSWGKATGNYYTKGSAVFTGKVKASQAKKVSKITAKNCPKLSSKYWVYSKAKGRMILKNNKEK